MSARSLRERVARALRAAKQPLTASHLSKMLSIREHDVYDVLRHDLRGLVNCDSSGWRYS